MNHKSRIIGMIGLFCTILLCLSSCKKSLSYEEDEYFAMDTIMSWRIYETTDSSVGEEIKEVIKQAEKMISVTDTGSELSQINQSAGNSFQISDEMGALLASSLEYCYVTDGALNIALYPVVKAWGFTADASNIPSADELEQLLQKTDYSRIIHTDGTLSMPEGYALDLGAVGKGYVTDCCVKLLKEQGISSAMLNLGGNVYAHGVKEDGTSWRIGIQLPYGDVTDYAGILSVQDKAVVTSGTYQRYFEEGGKKYHHILDGKTGYPADNELDSVTIVCPEGMKADALSTAYFVMGPEKSAEHWRSQNDVEVIWITKDKKVYYTEGLEGIFTVTDGLTSELVYR